MSIVIKNKFLKRINEIIFKKKLNRPIAQCHLHEFKCTHTKQQLISIRIYLNPKVYFSYCLLQILYFVFHLSTQHLSNFYFSYLCHFFSVFLIIKVSSIRDLKLFGSLLFSHFLQYCVSHRRCSINISLINDFVFITLEYLSVLYMWDKQKKKKNIDKGGD